MARIELRDAIIKIKDGLAGTAAINQMGTMSGDTDLDIDTVVLNTDVTNKVPVGARFTVAGETAATTVHVVTARDAFTSAGPTTNIVFTPALTALERMLTALSSRSLANQIEIKVGDGDLKYTEKNEYTYDLDRGDLDTVREGNQVPMDLVLDFVYEHITTGTARNDFADGRPQAKGQRSGMG
jgi:hypothetical protein